MLRAVQSDSKSSDREASSRRVLTAALLGSFLIHLGLGLLFVHFSKPVSSKLHPPPMAGIEIEVQRSEHLAAPEKPPETTRPKVESGPARGAAERSAKIARGHAVTPEPSPREERTGSAGGLVTPQAGDVPHRLDLALHGPMETASPGGKTTRNVPGEAGGEETPPSLAQARIDAWIDDDSATRRVEKGMVDDWFAGLHRALDHALQAHPPPTSVAPSSGAALVRQYADSAARFGATGNPNEPSNDSRGPGGPVQIETRWRVPWERLRRFTCRPTAPRMTSGPWWSSVTISAASSRPPECWSHRAAASSTFMSSM